MRLVVIESPYAGPTEKAIEENVRYARAAVRDCIQKGESPIASHLLFTQPGILRDGLSEERAQGIACGLAWHAVCDAVVVYEDFGISPGMLSAIEHARKLNKPIEYRKLIFGKDRRGKPLLA